MSKSKLTIIVGAGNEIIKDDDEELKPKMNKRLLYFIKLIKSSQMDFYQITEKL